MEESNEPKLRDYCPNIYCAGGTGKNNIPKPDKMSTVHTVL